MRKLATLLRMVRNRDSLLRFFLLRKLGAWLVPKYRFNWPQLAWWDDDVFSAYLRRFDEIDGCNSDRHWALGQLTRLVADVAGDTAECGVFRGASSYLICRGNQLAPNRRVHHLFDSFQGLSEPSILDGSFWSAGDLACPLSVVKENLEEFGEEAVCFHQGWIPERFHELSQSHFSFVHIDVDLHEPTRDSLEFFYPRMSEGGIILCDDYGFTSCPGATAAFDEYLMDKPEPMIALPCGGGFLIKRAPQTV